MNRLTISSILLLFTIVSFASVTSTVFAEDFTVSLPEGSSLQSCAEKNECYIPYNVTIDVGDKVIWSNDDVAFHTVTSGTSDEPGELFDSGMFTKDEKFSHKFEISGNFDYYCTLHPWMEGIVLVREATAEDTNENEGGGCLIATAAFGTELAPQVQFLREIRDNTVMSTSSGASFMTGFNQVYYSFSPVIADMERENPAFQEAVRVFITPMISTLSIMTLAEDGNDSQVLGLGLSVIALNLGMYIAAPAAIGFTIHREFQSNN